jgi:hypothetical protein
MEVKFKGDPVLKAAHKFLAEKLSSLDSRTVSYEGSHYGDIVNIEVDGDNIATPMILREEIEFSAPDGEVVPKFDLILGDLCCRIMMVARGRQVVFGKLSPDETAPQQGRVSQLMYNDDEKFASRGEARYDAAKQASCYKIEVLFCVR